MQTSDASLVASAAQGSERAFAELFHAYIRPVYWIAHGIVGNDRDAEDVTQDTFLVAWRKLADLELVSDSLLPWLATICRLQASNRVRRQRRDREHTQAIEAEDVAAVENVEQHVLDNELAELIIAEVSQLSKVDQSIFRLCVTEGYAYQAAAEQLGVSHAVVRNRLSRLRGKLRTTIRENV